jgi:uncharacterized membrane protein YbhN (UPF0104 family)
MGINLISLLVKGWSWHLLLKPLASNRWRTAQEANLVGATVNCLSVSVAGEAARIHWIVKQDRVPPQAAAASVVWARAVEAAGIALFLLIAPGFLRLPTALGGAQAGAGVLLIILLALILSRRGWRLAVWVPQTLRCTLESFAEIGSPGRLGWPIALALVNWTAQWTTFHLVLVSLGARPSLGASFVALLATNLGGLLRLTPANVGVFQVTMVAALLPFGIASEQGLAASLALQAIQVIPVVALGLGFGGWKTLRQLKEETSAD